MASYDLFQVNVTKSYSFSEWRNDLKKVLRRAGEDMKPTVFLFGDYQLKVNQFYMLIILFALRFLQFYCIYRKHRISENKSRHTWFLSPSLLQAENATNTWASAAGGREGRGPPWIFIHDTNIIDRGFEVLFFGLILLFFGLFFH